MQCCVLSPTIFVLYMNDVLPLTESYSSCIPISVAEAAPSRVSLANYLSQNIVPISELGENHLVEKTESCILAYKKKLTQKALWKLKSVVNESTEYLTRYTAGTSTQYFIKNVLEYRVLSTKNVLKVQYSSTCSPVPFSIDDGKGHINKYNWMQRNDWISKGKTRNRNEFWMMMSI